MGASGIPEDLVNLYQRFGGEAVSYHEFGARPDAGVRWLPFEKLQPKVEQVALVEPVNDAVICQPEARPEVKAVEVAAVEPASSITQEPPVTVTPQVAKPVVAEVAPAPAAAGAGSLSELFARLDKVPSVAADTSLRSVLNKLSK
jgi:hypothetical protein